MNNTTFELDAALDRIRQANLYQAPPRQRRNYGWFMVTAVAFTLGLILGLSLPTEEIAVYFEPDERARLVAQVEEFLQSGDCPDYWLEDTVSLLKKLRSRP